MEETSNYHLNKPSLKDKSKIMPVIQNFSNIEIIVNRIILEMNEFINNFNNSLTLDKINEFKLSLREELKAIYLEKSTIDEIMNKIEELMTDKATLIEREEMKNFIMNFIQESYLSKQDGNNNYGLKSDYTESQRLEKEGRKKLAQALNNQGVQTPLESNYDVISQNIKKIEGLERNCLSLVEAGRIKTYSHEFEITSETGGIIFFSPTRLYPDGEISSSKIIDLLITVDDHEPIKVTPSEARGYSLPALFYPIALPISMREHRGVCAGVIQFNNKVKIEVIVDDSSSYQINYSVYKWKRKEVRNTKLKKLKANANISNNIHTFNFTFNGKGIFSPTFMIRQGVTTRVKLFIDNKEPIVFYSYSRKELESLGVEVNPEIYSWAYDSNVIEVYSNTYNIRKGFYIKNSIRIEVEEYSTSSNKVRDLYYQFTPL